MDVNGDGIIDKEEARAIARSTAGLRASKSKYQKGLIATVALLVLSWIGNAGLMVTVVNLSKDIKVEGDSALKTVDGDSISTVRRTCTRSRCSPTPPAVSSARSTAALGRPTPRRSWPS